MASMFSPLEQVLAGADTVLCYGVSPITRRLLTNSLRHFHPATEDELILGLALEAFIEGPQEADPEDLTEAYLRVMVTEGFPEAEIRAHLLAPEPIVPFEPNLF